MMKKILQRYIAKAILTGTLLSLAVITGIVILLLLLAELKDLGQGDYGVLQMLLYVLMKLPNELYQYAPMVMLLGSMIGLSILTAYRELTVMRASGFSMKLVIGSVLSAAFLIILTLSVGGEWVGPDLSYRAEIYKDNSQNAGQAVITASGVWYHVDENFIHIKRVIDRQQLEGVTRYQFDDHHQLLASYYAKLMTLERGEWVMHDVVGTQFYHDRTKAFAQSVMPLGLTLNTNLFNIGLVDANEMSLHKLARFTRYLDENGLQSTEYKYQFWQRLLQPIGSMIMVLIALPFVLGLFSKASMGMRLFAGVIAGFIFFICNALLGEIAIVYQVPALIAALIPLVIFFIVGLYLSRRIILFS